MGLLYLVANKDCTGFEREMMVNCSLELFEKATEFEDTREEALDKVQTYQQFLPSKETLLKKGIPVIDYNQPREVGCLLKAKINKIRSKD